MDLGILSLSDLQTSPDTGQKGTVAQRIAETVNYAVLGEHHSLYFAVSSPAVVLAAIAAGTSGSTRPLADRLTAHRAARATCPTRNPARSGPCHPLPPRPRQPLRANRFANPLPLKVKT
jgi:hypothetical protein